MSNDPASIPVRRSSNRRWIRQLHLWIGAWGALAAVLYGFTGLVMNHRSGDNPWPQGDSVDRRRVVLQVPAQARGSAEALSSWLRESRGLDAQSIRKGAPRGTPDDALEQWNLSGGNARDAWTLQYAPGAGIAEIRHSRQTWLAAFNRLHKNVGGGQAWRLLTDSFALCMLLLGVSGLWMWARGRNAREMIVSVLSASLLMMLAVLGPALL